MLTQKNFFGLVKSMAGSNDVIAVNMTLVRFTGSWPAGIILSQLLYWTDRTKIADGWICKSHGDWYDEVYLSEHNCREARRRLETEMQIVEVIQKKFDGTPKPHYRILEDAFIKAFVTFLDSRNFRPSEILTDVRQDTGQTMECQENRGTITETTTYTETYLGQEERSLNLFGLETKKEKAPQVAPAPPQPGKAIRQVKPLQYFKDSLWNDPKYTTEFFQGTTFATVDWPYYLKKFSAWSDLKKKKRDVAGWQKTMETWVIKEHNSGTLLTTDTKLGTHAINKPSSNGKQTSGQSFEDIEAKYS